MPRTMALVALGLFLHPCALGRRDISRIIGPVLHLKNFILWAFFETKFKSGHGPWASHDSRLATDISDSTPRPLGASPLRLYEAQVLVRDRRRSGVSCLWCRDQVE